MDGIDRVAIIGASAAGLAVAEGLRRYGFDREIVLVGEEEGTPYDRPPLSKQVLRGDWDASRAALLPPSRLDAIAATNHLGVRADGLDVGGRTVLLENGAVLSFDEVVIATGVRARCLPGSMPCGVYTLRTLSDAVRLRAELSPGRRLLIVGGGFLGLEVAATARGLGVAVTVVEPTRDPLANRLGAPTARRLVHLHELHDVDVRVGRTVAKLLVTPSPGTPKVAGALLDDGSKLNADVVLVAIGSVPNVDWLNASGLDISDGVRCDSYCRAAPHVWAVGDVARWTHNGAHQSVRIEHRTNATEQGDHVARNILGEARPYSPIPFFWTDQYDVKVQVAGMLPSGCSDELESGAEDGRSFIRRFVLNGRTMGVLGWNAAKALIPLRRELANDAALMNGAAS